MRASSIITVNQLNGLLHNKRTVPTVTLRNLIFRICSNLLQIAKHLTVKAVNHGVGSTDHFLKFLWWYQVICASGTCTNFPSAENVNLSSLACKIGISSNCASGTCTNGKSASQGARHGVIRCDTFKHDTLIFVCKDTFS